MNASAATPAARVPFSSRSSLEDCARSIGIDFLAERGEGNGVGVSLPAPAVARAAQSAAVRRLAAQILRMHGLSPPPDAKHPDGSPQWPEGWTGSYAHSAGWGVAALARSEKFLSIGADVEYPARMSRAMWSHIMTARELAILEGLANEEAARHATAVFSAKESIFKAVAPLCRKAPGFFDVEIVWTDNGGFRPAFIGEIGGDFPGGLRGVVAFSDQMVWTLCWISRTNFTDASR